MRIPNDARVQLTMAGGCNAVCRLPAHLGSNCACQAKTGLLHSGHVHRRVVDSQRCRGHDGGSALVLTWCSEGAISATMARKPTGMLRLVSTRWFGRLPRASRRTVTVLSEGRMRGRTNMFTLLGSPRGADRLAEGPSKGPDGLSLRFSVPTPETFEGQPTVRAGRFSQPLKSIQERHAADCTTNSGYTKPPCHLLLRRCLRSTL